MRMGDGGSGGWMVETDDENDEEGKDDGISDQKGLWMTQFGR